jgi:WhiB family redox-sensing transcriptional regulator
MTGREGRYRNLSAATTHADLRWQDRAACVGQDPGIWTDDHRQAEAATVCGSCPVRADCLEHALTGRIRHGVWGGLTPEQRQLERQRRRHALKGDG